VQNLASILFMRLISLEENEFSVKLAWFTYPWQSGEAQWSRASSKSFKCSLEDRKEFHKKIEENPAGKYSLYLWLLFGNHAPSCFCTNCYSCDDGKERK
jgi:hypothetical protein